MEIDLEIGTRFRSEDGTLLEVKSGLTDGNLCDYCHFKNSLECASYSCLYLERKDGNDVIFAEVVEDDSND